MTPSKPTRSQDARAQDTRTELGTDTELAALVDRVRSFEPEYATTSESMALARALKIIASDIVRRHDGIVALENTLREKLDVASVAAELSGVIDVMRPAHSHTQSPPPAVTTAGNPPRRRWLW